MGITHGKYACADVCRALGIDPSMVCRLVIDLRPTDVPVIYVEYAMSQDQAAALSDILPKVQTRIEYEGVDR